MGEDHPATAAAEIELVRSDLDQHLAAIAPPVAPDARRIDPRSPLVAGDRGERVEQARNLLRRPDVLDRHGEEFLAAITVTADRRVVHVEEGERIEVEDPHRLRVGGEHPAVASLALLQRLRGLAGWR
jgi:hypothetical protein